MAALSSFTRSRSRAASSREDACAGSVVMVRISRARRRARPHSVVPIRRYRRHLRLMDPAPRLWFHALEEISMKYPLVAGLVALLIGGTVMTHTSTAPTPG